MVFKKLRQSLSRRRKAREEKLAAATKGVEEARTTKVVAADTASKEDPAEDMHKDDHPTPSEAAPDAPAASSMDGKESPPPTSPATSAEDCSPTLTGGSEKMPSKDSHTDNVMQNDDAPAETRDEPSPESPTAGDAMSDVAVPEAETEAEQESRAQKEAFSCCGIAVE